MLLVIAAVRDRSAEFYFPPFFVRSQVEAIRAFSTIMSNENRTGAPSEYELVIFGEFTDADGKFSIEPVPRMIANGADVVKPT